MKTFVMGDPHGAYKAIVQVLKRASFDYAKDKLICLGDVADGWNEVPEAFEELLKIKHLVYVRGNHDQWLKDYLKKGKQPDIWLKQGGQESKLGYDRLPGLKEKHLEFLKKTEFYHIDEENRCFVHGGVIQGEHPKDTDKQFLSWDRSMWNNRYDLDGFEDDFKEIYVGHTSIYRFSRKPLWFCNVCFMDTGGGWEGVLSVMNIDTKEVFQSDKVLDLYPNQKGRN